MSRLRALVVDDEEPARRRLEDLLASEPEWEVVGSADNGADAVEAIRSLRPDLVLLDIQMPELTGFEVLERVGVANMPSVIFVTAYDQYALQAFESCAVDYLLKPFADARFEQSLRRCEEHIRLLRLDSVRERMEKLLETLSAASPDPVAQRIPVQSRDRTLLLPIHDIDFVSADGPYMRLHVGERDFLIRERMHAIEKRLGGNGFLRIHRSTVVNLERVVAIEPYFRGEAFVRLRGGDKLKVSRSRREALYAALGVADTGPSTD